MGFLGLGELAGLGVVRGLRLPLEVEHGGGVALEEEAPEARGLQVGGSRNESWIRGLGVAQDGRDDLVVHLALLEDRASEAGLGLPSSVREGLDGYVGEADAGG